MICSTRHLRTAFPPATRSLSTSIHLETGKRAKSAENDLRNGPETASGASLFSCTRFGPDGSCKTAGNPAIEQHANSKAGCHFEKTSAPGSGEDGACGIELFITPCRRGPPDHPRLRAGRLPCCPTL